MHSWDPPRHSLPCCVPTASAPAVWTHRRNRHRRHGVESVVQSSSLLPRLFPCCYRQIHRCCRLEPLWGKWENKVTMGRRKKEEPRLA